jgi:hypothetical protein
MMTSTYLKGVQYSITYRTYFTERAEPAALRVIQRMKAAKCFPTTKAYDVLSRPTGEFERAAIYFPHSPFPVHENHYYGHIVKDSGKFRFALPQRLLRPLTLGF